MTTTTTTTEEDQILKRDRLGRVKTPRDRREALLAEFDRSGLSGAQFAKWAGIKYGTFITWVQRRKRQAETNPVEARPVAAAPAVEVRWVEAVRDEVPEKSHPRPQLRRRWWCRDRAGCDWNFARSVMCSGRQS